MKQSRLEITLRDSLYPPEGSTDVIRYDASIEGHPRYQVWLYLEGPDLPYVRKATYHLHPTFPEPIRVVRRTPSNPNCALAVWAWGMFDVRAEVEDKRGHRHTLRHRLAYDRQIKQDARYEQVKLEG